MLSKLYSLKIKYNKKKTKNLMAKLICLAYEKKYFVNFIVISKFEENHKEKRKKILETFERKKIVQLKWTKLTKKIKNKNKFERKIPKKGAYEGRMKLQHKTKCLIKIMHCSIQASKTTWLAKKASKTKNVRK